MLIKINDLINGLFRGKLSHIKQYLLAYNKTLIYNNLIGRKKNCFKDKNNFFKIQNN